MLIKIFTTNYVSVSAQAYKQDAQLNLPAPLHFPPPVVTAAGLASLLQHNAPHSLTGLICPENHFSHISKSLGVKPVILLTLGYSIPVTSPH